MQDDTRDRNNTTSARGRRDMVSARAAPRPSARRWWLVGVLPFLAGSCDTPASADAGPINIDFDQVTWQSAGDGLWGIADVLEKDGMVWVLSSAAPFVHGLREGAEVVTFGNRGEGPDELRSASALLATGDVGQVTVWDSGSRLYRTFSDDGRLTATRNAPATGRVRSDIDIVTFGDPLRVAATAAGIVRAEFPGEVSWGNNIWTGRLVRTDTDENAEVVVEFADLPGASQVNPEDRTMLGPVPVWDACPDGRIALLDPVARHLYLVGSTWEERDSVSVPWEVETITRSHRLAYLTNQFEAELRGGPAIDDSEKQAMVEGAEEASRDWFAPSAPVGVDVKCSADRVWIQEFEGGAHPLGLGRRWRTIDLAGGGPTYSQVVVPVGFRPYRISDSRMLGVVTDSLDLQKVVGIRLP